MYIYVGPSWSSTAAAAGWTRDARRLQCELEKKFCGEIKIMATENWRKKSSLV